MRKILVVDDEDEIRKVLRLRLSSAGYEVLDADNGKTAIEVAKAQRPDLIILDILMPELDGMKASEIMKKDPATAKIPIIFLTALRSRDDEKRRGDKVGANLIFAKPFDHVKLLSKIEEILSNNS
jgi:CheY-like chemotaxis protein